MQQRVAKRRTEGLDSKSTVLIVLHITESRWWELNSTGVGGRESQHHFEQRHRGDHFIIELPSNASSWDGWCIQKPIAQPSVVGIEACVVGMCCRANLDL